MVKHGKKFIAIAALLGVAAAIVGYLGLTQLAARAAAATGSQLREVVVTAADLTFGTKLERTMLRVVRYPKDAVPAGAFSTADSVVGQTTKVFLSAREPITATKLSSRGGGLSMLIRPDMRAASVEVNQVSGVSGFVLPGDRVDVLSTVDSRGGVSDAVTRTLLQNVEVLAAGQKTQQQDNKPITVQAVTLLVDPQGAEIVAHAQHEGEINLVLRNPEDQKEVKVSGFSTREMLGIAEPTPRPSGTRRVIVERTVFRTSEPSKVRIIRSADVSEQPVLHDSTIPNH